MKTVWAALTFILVVLSASAQKVSFAEMNSMLDMEQFAVDTLMKKKGYRLMEKEVDSVSSLYYYSHLERNDDSPSWVRSLSYMEATRGQLHGIKLNYRTYNRNEYQELMSALLSNGYKTVKSFDLDKEKHTIFSNSTQTVTVKLKNNPMGNGKWIRSYEFELGK